MKSKERDQIPPLDHFDNPFLRLALDYLSERGLTDDFNRWLIAGIEEDEDDGQAREQGQ